MLDYSAQFQVIEILSKLGFFKGYPFQAIEEKLVKIGRNYNLIQSRGNSKGARVLKENWENILVRIDRIYSYY